MGMSHPQTLVEFMEMYPTQDACRRALFEQRWREGFRRPRCAHEVAWYLRGSGLRGRASQRKTLVAVSAQHTPGGGLGRAHLRVIDDASAKTLTGAAGVMIQPGSTVRTDGWRSYGALPAAGYRHEPHVQPTPQAASELLPWVHIVISNFKRWQLDVFHGVSAAHLQSYLDEFCYRLNRRDQRLDLFRRILNRRVLYTPPTTYAQLIARAA